MKRIIHRCPHLILAVCLAISGLSSIGAAQENKTLQRVTLKVLQAAAADSMAAGKPVMVYMFDSI
ncbi:MAG: hypothetical protein ACI87E_000281 [Mariniblastus sp.]|jgi:hypothetical protein